MPVFIPCAPTGLWTWPASPRRKNASFAKTVGHAVMDPIRREPVHRRHVDAKQRLDSVANVLEGEVRALGELGRHESDQALHSPRPHGQHQHENVLAKSHVQIGLEPFGGLHVGDVEQLVVRAAWKSDRRRLAHTAVGPVTAAEIVNGRFPSLAVVVLDRRAHGGVVLDEPRRAGCSTRRSRRAGAACR